MIVRVLIDQAKEIAAKRATRFADEHMSHGPDALKHIAADVRSLLREVYAYQARFEAARLAMVAPRNGAVDYLMTCDKALPAAELNGVEALMEEVRQIAKVSADLEARALGRIRNQVMTTETLIAQRQEALRRLEAHNGDGRLLAQRSSDLRKLSREYARFMEQIAVLERKADDLEETCAKILAILADIRTKLLQHQEGFVLFAQDCRNWQAARRAQGAY